MFANRGNQRLGNFPGFVNIERGHHLAPGVFAQTPGIGSVGHQPEQSVDHRHKLAGHSPPFTQYTGNRNTCRRQSSRRHRFTNQ
jgi:hypothetical protein